MGGVVVDTSVFIAMEKRGEVLDLSRWSHLGNVYVSAMTVSELLVGVHRAESETRREKRLRFVRQVLAAIQVLDFDTAVAEVHARIHAELASRGKGIGSNDLIIAATALHHGCAVLTGNSGEFNRIAGLNVVGGL